jgi:hypothetical protein
VGCQHWRRSNTVRSQMDLVFGRFNPGRYDRAVLQVCLDVIALLIFPSFIYADQVEHLTSLLAH